MEQARRLPQPSNPVALIAGCSGINGWNLSKLLLEDEKYASWKVIGISRKGKGMEFLQRSSRGSFVPVDLLDAADTRAKFADRHSDISSVTHAFFCAYIPKDTEDEMTRVNGSMFRNFLETLRQTATGLRHVCLVTGTKYYGSHLESYRTPAREDDPRIPRKIFYYEQEDCLQELAAGQSWTWSVIRPQDLLGFAQNNAMNIGTTLAAYGSLCRELQMPFVFPGTAKSYRMLYDSSSINIVNRIMLWCATTPQAANQAFNVTNGDVYRFDRLWPAIARWFGLDPVTPAEGQRVSLEEMFRDMPKFELEWRKMVDKYGLQPYRLEELVTWSFADMICGREYDSVTDMSKARELGFDVYRSTEHVYDDLFNQLRDTKIIPNPTDAPSARRP